MFNTKLHKEIDDLKTKNEQLKTENEQLKIKLAKTERELQVQLSVHMPELYRLKKECYELGVENENRKQILSKVRKRKKIKPEELEKPALYRVEFRRDGYCIEQWIIPVMPEESESSEALEWWERGRKKEWESEVQRIYFQPNIGWIVVRKYRKDFPVISAS